MRLRFPRRNTIKPRYNDLYALPLVERYNEILLYFVYEPDFSLHSIYTKARTNINISPERDSGAGLILHAHIALTYMKAYKYLYVLYVGGYYAIRVVE